MQTERQALSVTQLNEYLKMVLEGDRVLSSVFVRGEISNFKLYSSGHAYFTLKDEAGQLKSVMFRSYFSRLAFLPEDGMRVIAHGRVSVYETNGQYQLYVDDLQPDGAGSLAIRFEQLKRKLAAEGLFDESRKRPLPKMPKRIGVITSPSGAAVHDIINVLGRRFPATEMILYPSEVQGAQAPAQLISGVEFFSMTGLVDVIILGRGGGSAEDLWAFNDEYLARAVASCSVPVISAVGHESDFTICDFVADRRAPTPSAAAEIAVPDMGEILRGFASLKVGMQTSLQKRITQEKRILGQITASRVFKHPEQMLDGLRMRLDERESDLNRAIEQTILQRRQITASVAGKLQALNPLSILSRGYATVSRDGATVTSVKQINDNDTLDIRMADGSVRARVSQRKDIQQ
ncbi:MAG: exodeoxyribonuclease VII large subunit [Ruminococcaceae bacterium]|nr:exodeoxyribonuclease VII large subunit [Oscillospiraceae bacterium]